VPPGASQITISYDYDHANGLNVLDIGLFDSRAGDGEGDVAGFRGWSGGRRAEFFVARAAATPGYIPGDLRPGTWRIILGLYRVVPEGVDVSFKINIEATATNVVKQISSHRVNGMRLSSPATTDERKTVRTPQGSRRWVTGDLHMHSVNSDGDWTIPELIAAAKVAGLDFVAITDHNTYSHHVEMDRLAPKQTDLLLIRGEEITTYGGHANAWGLPANVLIDFRIRPGDKRAMSRVASETHRRGALISINHPFALCAGCNWSYDQDAEGFDAIEVWNGLWETADEQALTWWDTLLQKGRRITAVASSDSHRPANTLGQAATRIAIDGSLTPGAVLKSIREGHAYLTGLANGPPITFEARTPEGRATYSVGDTIRLRKSHRVVFKIAAGEANDSATITLISQGQVIRTLSTDDGKAQFVKVDPTRNAYFRMELRDQNGKMLAMTNPIYVETRR
jgi:broad specificity phosphatase PhoE